MHQMYETSQSIDCSFRPGAQSRSCSQHLARRRLSSTLRRTEPSSAHTGDLLCKWEPGTESPCLDGVPPVVLRTKQPCLMEILSVGLLAHSATLYFLTSENLYQRSIQLSMRQCYGHSDCSMLAEERGQRFAALREVQFAGIGFGLRYGIERHD